MCLIHELWWLQDILWLAKLFEVYDTEITKSVAIISKEKMPNMYRVFKRHNNHITQICKMTQLAIDW